MALIDTAIDLPGALAAPAPRHVAIIMDGNGRWASARGLPRFEGHRRGVEALRRTVRAAIELGVAHLTVYGFSSENWRRPPDEVADLFSLLRRFIRNDLAELHAQGIRVRVAGSRHGLPGDVLRLLDEAVALTRGNGRLVLVVAFNYGGRDELLRAVRRLAGEAAAGRLDPEVITEDVLAGALDTAGLPDPDLVIRTSGERRLSNFLVWQSAYAELVFSPVLWPDFGHADLAEALRDYAGRDRRFGGRAACGT